MFKFIKNVDKNFIEDIRTSVALRVVVYFSLAVNAFLVTDLLVKLLRG